VSSYLHLVICLLVIGDRDFPIGLLFGLSAIAPSIQRFGSRAAARAIYRSIYRSHDEPIHDPIAR